MNTSELIVKKDSAKSVTFVDKNGQSFGFAMSQLMNWTPVPKPIPATLTAPASKAVHLEIRLNNAVVTIICNPVASELIVDLLTGFRLFKVGVGEHKGGDDPRGPAKVTDIKVMIKGATNPP